MSDQVTPDNCLNKKLLDRIRKLYAMSLEVEASPHEAEIALRRCTALMERYGVTEDDLETSEFGAASYTRTTRSLAPI